MSTPAELEDRSPAWQRARAWIERELGGRVVRAERQARWRPAWFFDLERDGASLPLYFRGERGATDHGVYPLEHELRVLQVLERHGIPVPHVYGFCSDPRGIVMQRCPGRANLAGAGSEAERVSVLDHYVEILARMHALDAAEFEAVGLGRPRTPEALGLMDFPAWEAAYRAKKRRPEPLVEFGIRWVRRNVPRHRRRVSFLCADAGQFLFEGGRVTAVHDLELACLGDPLADLGGMRGRDLSEPLGDLSRAFRRYAELTGEELDLPVLDYHTIRFALCTPLAVAHLCAEPAPGMNLAQYLGWYHVYGRAAIELVGRAAGAELAAPELPEPEATRQAPAHAALRSLLAAPEHAAEAGGARYSLDAALRLALYLERADARGPALESQDLDEAAQLLGRRPASWREADAALEELVARAGPERDAELARYFYRRSLRQEALLAPALRELEHAALQPIA
jgi:aminoglycoside phosphotransferase (APT) family kinase protein